MTKAHLVTVVASHDGTDPQRDGTRDAGSAVVIDGDRTVTPPEVRLCAADQRFPPQGWCRVESFSLHLRRGVSP